jgi:hypothetical protein
MQGRPQDQLQARRGLILAPAGQVQRALSRAAQ